MASERKQNELVVSISGQVDPSLAQAVGLFLANLERKVGG
jgi:hypothetical protein